MPPFVLQDQTGARIGFDRIAASWCADFIYTACADLCVIAGNSLNTIRDALPEDRLGKDVVLLSISFDMVRDTVPQLAYYASRHRAMPEHWAVATVTDGVRLSELLKVFGVTVIPDRWGGFQHNSAIYVVNRDSSLVAIFDYDDPSAVLRFLEGQA